MRAKKLPRLWCALQGLLPLEQCLAAQEGELGWPRQAVGVAASPVATAAAAAGRARRKPAPATAAAGAAVK